MKFQLFCLKGYSTISTARSKLTSVSLAKKIAGLASDKKAEGIVVLEMKKLVNFCDYFVLCSGNTDRHAKGIAEGIEDGLKALGLKVRLNKNLRDYSWVVLDTGAVIAHVFVKNLREFYNLEYLWREAKQINWQK